MDNARLGNARKGKGERGGRGGGGGVTALPHNRTVGFRARNGVPTLRQTQPNGTRTLYIIAIAVRPRDQFRSVDPNGRPDVTATK